MKPPVRREKDKGLCSKEVMAGSLKPLSGYPEMTMEGESRCSYCETDSNIVIASTSQGYMASFLNRTQYGEIHG